MEHTAEDAPRSEALMKAAGTGWNDIAAGRYVDVTDEGLGDFIGALGEQAADQVRARR